MNASAPGSGVPADDAASHDTLLGTELGDYLILERLGGGGMGAVYRADDLALRRPVALKVMLAHLLGDATARTRFQREIRHAAAIEHPHVVPVYDAGFERGRFYIAMRLVEGPDLGAVLRRGPLSIDRAARLISQVAAALRRVHQQGLVHRDIKPQNILIAEYDTPAEYALLGDFGIARDVESATALTGGLIGTAEYMAPEVLRWQPASPASDQYALSCLLFEMLAGRSPYRDEALPAAHLESPVPRLRDHAPHVPDSLASAVERALEKDPGDRFQSVEEFGNAVASATSRPAGVSDSKPGEEGAAIGGSGPRTIFDVGEPAETTLHSEIAAVLRENGNGWMATREIAQSVNRRGRYQARDNAPVTGSQVLSRTQQHAELFERNGVRVKLR